MIRILTFHSRQLHCKPANLVLTVLRIQWKPFIPRFEPAKVDQIFLDINDTWTRAEIAATEAWILTHKVYAVSNNEFIQLTDENWQDITDENRQRNFSIFPFHRITNEKGSLVITKGKSLSPAFERF